MTAKTIYYVKQGGTGNGTLWSVAAGNIQDMIDQAVVGDEVWVAKGIYYPTKQTDAADVRTKTFALKDGVHLYGGFAGTETSIGNRAKSDKDGNGMTEAWEFTNETMLSGDIDGITGNDNNSYRVVTNYLLVSDEFVIESLFDGFTVAEGNGGSGGGIYARGRTVVQRCIITGNSANYGGGIYVYESTVNDCLIAAPDSLRPGGTNEYRPLSGWRISTDD